MHRLDTDTSGLLLISLSPFATRRLSKQFEQRSIEKLYQALVFGKVNNEQQFIRLPIARADFPRQQIDLNGKQAITEIISSQYDESEHNSLLLLKPHTGRTHQLRLHCMSIGHPILGCRLYYQHNSQNAKSRLMLHAKQLRFHHPKTKHPITIINPFDLLER